MASEAIPYAFDTIQDRKKKTLATRRADVLNMSHGHGFLDTMEHPGVFFRDLIFGSR